MKIKFCLCICVFALKKIKYSSIKMIVRHTHYRINNNL